MDKVRSDLLLSVSLATCTMRPTVALAIAILPCVAGALQSCPQLSSQSPDVFDFIVVGSGAGGGPLAARLAENGFSVFLVDAGDDVNIFNTTLPAYWGRATEDPTTELAYNIKEFSDPDSRIAWYPRARALGGSTIHNAMINIIAGTRSDFDSIANIFKDSSWSRNNMQAYFKKLEQNLYLLPTLLTLSDHGFSGWLKTTLLPYTNLLHNLAGADLQLLSVFASMTALSPNPPILDLNSLASDGSIGLNTPSFTVDESHIRSSVYNRLTAVANSKSSKLNITLGTLVTRVLLCQSNNTLPTAYGVEIAPGAALAVAGNFVGKQNLTVRNVMARHEVIISGGVFQSPQLLMLSGIGNSSELSAVGIEPIVNLPGVGTNLQDHDEVAIIWKLKNNFKLFAGCTFLSDPAKDPCLQDWINSDHMNVYAFNPVLSVIITKSNESLAAPDIFTYVAPAFFKGIFRGFSQEVVDNPDGFTAIVLKAHPSSRGFVRLTGSHPQDPLDIQKMHFEAEQGPDDVQALVDGLMRIRTLVETSPMAAFVDEEVFPGTNASLTEHVFERVFGHHACCTNPIGTDSNAVLDSEFRVRGVDRLRVVDMSVWPNVPGYFVTTPTYMISEKAADALISAAQAKLSEDGVE
ncbi:GMC oxidoreductase [Mycena alexandri]|uniref:GMC oxidoreductase n=1 Tax=Mycena alexandri TaxID=1745969 RepID=A0AAD6XB93_9AGAR|nr:GMC oxidoreductase [Mycena alexandri]